LKEQRLITKAGKASLVNKAKTNLITVKSALRNSITYNQNVTID